MSRSRFGAPKTRTKTTAAPNEDASSSTATPSSKPSLTRPRATFNLKGRGRTTTSAPNDEDSASSQEASTTVRTRKIQPAGSGVRPLRPGPKINLTRGRPGQTTTTTTTEEPEDHVTGDEEHSTSDTPDEKVSF